MKKILIIDREMFPYNDKSVNGGAEAVVIQHLKALFENKDFEVHLYCTNDSEVCDLCHKQHYSKNLSKYAYKEKSERANVNYMKVFKEEINILLENENFDLIMAHSYDDYGVWGLAPFTKRTACVFMEHQCKESRGGVAQIKHYNRSRLFVENGGYIVTPSKFTSDDLNKYVSSRWGFEPFYKDFIYPYFFDDSWEVKDFEDYTIMIARIDKIKRVHIACEAFKSLPNRTLKIYGNCYFDNKQYKDYYDELMSKFGHLKNIKWHINEPREAVIDALSKAKNYILTSPNECFSVSCAEALNFGIPIVYIAQPHGFHGYDDIEHEYEGLCKKVTKIKYKKVETNELLVKSIEEINSSKYNLSIRKKIRNTAKKHFSKNNLYNIINKIIDNFEKEDNLFFD